MTIKELFENAYMICDEIHHRDRILLEKALFKYHNIPFPKIFKASTDAGDCISSTNNSHLQLLKMAKQKKLPFVMVFEDDTYPCNNIQEKLKVAIERIPTNSDIIQLGFTGKKVNDQSNGIFQHITTNTVTGMHSYIIFNQAYVKLIRLLMEKNHVDRVQNQFEHAYVIKYPIFIQYNFDSSYWNHQCSYFVQYMKEDVSQNYLLEFVYKNYLPVERILNDVGSREFIKADNIHIFIHKNNHLHKFKTWESIPKNLFLIHIYADELPSWVVHVRDAYQKANPDFNVELISYSIQDVVDIYNSVKQDKYGSEIIESIDAIKQKIANIYNGRFSKTRLDRIVNGTHVKMNNPMRWIRVFTDVFRQLLMADYGGIYVDTDTFPIKPFDDYILECPFNCCTNHNIDSFFMGNCKQNKQTLLADYFERILEPRYEVKEFPENEDFSKFILSLEYKPNLQSKYYIKHFFYRSWKKGELPNRYLSDIFEVKLCYWKDNIKNFGDVLSPCIVERLSGRKCFHSNDSKTRKLFAIGSILDKDFNTIDGDIIWGSGVMHKEYVPPKNLDVELVRGPLTREALMKSGNVVPEKYCDPGVLAPFLYNIKLEQQTTQDALFLLHWETKTKNPNLIKELDAAQVKHWDMSLHHPTDIMNEIAKSKIIVSNSLHGIIVAECMGKPSVWLTNGGEGQDKFKYHDYYLGSGRTVDDIKTLNWTPATNMREIEFTKPPKIDFKSLIETFPFDLIDKDILDKIQNYYPSNIILR